MISVIVPVYNAELYLRRCLDALTVQHVGDMEVILVDDASTDKSLSIATDYINSYEGPVCFRLLRHAFNRGVSAARNTGISAAKGNFIGFIDADDDISEWMYAILSGELSAAGSERVGIVSCGTWIMEADGDTVIGPKGPSNPSVVTIPASDFLGAILEERLSVSVWNKLFRREVIGNVRFPEGRINEEMPFFYELAKRLPDMNWETKVLPDRLYHYRLSPGSLCRTRNHCILIDHLANLDMITSDAIIDCPELLPALEAASLKQLLCLLAVLRDEGHPEHKMFERFVARLWDYTDSDARRWLDEDAFMIFCAAKYFSMPEIKKKGGTLILFPPQSLYFSEGSKEPQ